ncbi:MAG: hypothetical protein U0Q12_15465 [Vicinamibacterales bacterium]
MPRRISWLLGILFAATFCTLLVTPPGLVRLQAAFAAGPQQSSPIALNSGNSRLVNVNPDANSVSIFAVSNGIPSKLIEIDVGHDPASVAINPNPAVLKAYVANAADGTVSVVDLLTLTVTKTIAVGVEPSAIAMSPNGTRAYVANSASNTVSVLNAATDVLLTTIDVSSVGTAPRAIAVTNDGDFDDTDETIFVPMFYGQLRSGNGSLQEGQDDQREGHVATISAATNTLSGFVTLGPMANTGFNANGRLAPAAGITPSVASTNPQTFTTPTGAYPNQLAAVAIRPAANRAYVTSTAASPNGPLRFNSMVQGLISVFDTAGLAEIVAAQTSPSVRQTAPLNLNQGVNLDTTAPRLFLSNPVAMVWRPNGDDAWVVVQNSDVVTRLTVDVTGVPTVGNPLVAGPGQVVRVDLEQVPAGQIPGKAPRGIAIDASGTHAYVANFVSRSITTIDITAPTAPGIVSTVQSSALPSPGTAEATTQLGAELFYTGRGPDGRMSSESWGGCIVCHPQGRSDNVTWMFEAGPRQTIPLDGMFSKLDPSDQRILNWSAVRDENHDFELNTRGVFGGRGLIDDDRQFLAVGGANGATDSSAIEQFHQATGVVSTTNTLVGNAALPTLLGARRDFGLATLEDDRVLIVGGRTGAGQGSLVTGADAVLEFNPRTNVLTRRGATGFTPRHSLGAAAVRTRLGLRIYAIGGYATTSSAASPVAAVEEYNPTTDTWRTVASLPTGVAQFGVTAAGGVNTAEPRQLIHVFSGNKGSESAPALLDAATYTVQRFQADPTGPGAWTTATPAGLTARRNHGIATALRGVSSRVFVIGGLDAAGVALDSVEEYLAQAMTSVLTPHTPLPAPRASFGSGSSTSTNQIYVVGGVDGSNVDQSTILEYSIATNGAAAGPAGTPSGAWVTRGNLATARRGLGVSSPPGVTNFLTRGNARRDTRQDAIAQFIARSIRPAHAPVASTDAQAVAGRALFTQVGLTQPGVSCASCHGGPKWTRSTVDYTPAPSPDTGLGLGNERVIGAELRQTVTQGPNVLLNVGTFNAAGRQNEIRFNGADVSQAIAPLGANGFNIPSLLSVHETAPYFYSGLAQTLDEVLNGSQDGNGGTRHHFVTNALDRVALVAFLKSIDETTPIVPLEPNDTDGDGLTNDWETKFGFNPNSAAFDNGANGDPDGDGVTNLAELAGGTDPRVANVQNLSEGATGFFLERIAVANPGTDPAEFRVDFLTEAATVVTRTYALAGLSRMTITVNAIPGLEATAVSTIVTVTKGGVLAERLMTWSALDGSFYGGHLGKSVPSAGTSWFLAEGEAGFFDTYILLANGNATPATVTATYLLDSGSPIVRNYIVQPNARLTIYANDVPGLRGHAFSTAVVSSQPITVERAQYFGSTPTRQWNGGHDAAAISALSTSWYVAEGRTGPFFTMFLLLANPNAEASDVTIRYLKPGGDTVSQSLTLGPTSRTTIEVDTLAGLEDTDVSASITSSQPIAVERAMYWPGPYTTWYESHDSAGVTATGTQWALAEGEVGGPLNFNTFVLVANPSSAAATVTLTFLRTSGSPVTLTRNVAANARLTVAATEAGLGPSEQFGVLVTSTNDVPIVVEHAIYWNDGAVFWGGGGNETAVKLR